MAERAEALNPRARLVAALLLAFGIAAVQGGAVLPLVAALAGGVVLALGQGRRVVRGLRAPALLAMALLLVLPFAAGGTVLAQIGPLVLRQEGLQAAVLMATRLLSIVALTLALLAPLSPAQLVAGLRGLGLPGLITDLALLTARYLEETRAELARAQLARRLRGGRPGWRAVPDQAALLACALIRAQTRAERLWAAMRLRGHGAAQMVPAAALTTRDRVAMTGAAGAALALVLLDRMP